MHKLLIDFQIWFNTVLEFFFILAKCSHTYYFIIMSILLECFPFKERGKILRQRSQCGRRILARRVRIATSICQSQRSLMGTEECQLSRALTIHYGSLARAFKPASGLAQPLQGFLMIFTKCIMNANSAIFYTRVSSHLTTRDNVNSTLEYIQI